MFNKLIFSKKVAIEKETTKPEVFYNMGNALCKKE